MRGTMEKIWFDETTMMMSKLNIYLKLYISLLSESTPCGPVATWAFRHHVDNKNALVVAQHADVDLRDEYGCTMLHNVVEKQRSEGQTEIVLVRPQTEIL